MDRRLVPFVLSALALLAGCDEQPAGVPGLERIFGRTGQGPCEFSYPRAAALGRDGIYIVDKAARIQCYSPDGQFRFDWRTPEHAAGKPTGLGVGPDGRVYVADTHYARVLVYEADGTPAARFGMRGDGPGQFRMPTDVAVDAAGFIYVSEYGGNDRISKFTPQHEYLFSFGDPQSGPARLQRPQSLLIGADGTLWVADACNHRICQFSPAGRLLATFGRSGTGPGEFRFPYGIDWLADGTLVVVEYGANRVQRLDTSGQPLGSWGRAGRRPGELAYPWAVAVTADDRMCIVDSGNNRVQVVSARAGGVWRRE